MAKFERADPTGSLAGAQPPARDSGRPGRAAIASTAWGSPAGASRPHSGFDDAAQDAEQAAPLCAAQPAALSRVYCPARRAASGPKSFAEIEPSFKM